MRIKTLLVIAAVVAAPSSGRAQDTAPAGACASIESDSERLACYDRALRAARAPATSATAAAQAAPPAPAAASAGAGATAAGVGAVAGAAAVTAGGSASTAGAAPAPAATPPPPTRVNVQAPSSSISTSPRTSTRNAVAPSPQPAPTVAPSAALPVGIVPIVVLDARATPGRGVEFTTDRGDVWVQSDTQPLQLPPTPFNAQIKPGTFGSTFLVPENRLGIRVRHHD